jgi:hypothetical protein
MITGKDMEHGRGLMDTDTSGNGSIMSDTGMEYTDGLMEECITDNGNRINKMAKDIKGGQVEMNIGESSRMTCFGERESDKRTEYFIETRMKKASSSAEVKYHEILHY